MTRPDRKTLQEPGSRRIVRTGRTIDDINAAARAGFQPLVQFLRPSPDVHFSVAIFQNHATGEIQELSFDLREWPSDGKLVAGGAYYPYHFPSPFAAYLLPRDLVVGEEVWLDDLIEDLVAARGSNGFRPRLSAAPAVWNGRGFDILFDPVQDAECWIG